MVALFVVYPRLARTRAVNSNSFAIDAAGLGQDVVHVPAAVTYTPRP